MNMKKVLAGILSASLVLTLAACSGGSGTTSASGGEAKARILQRQVRLNGSVCTQRGKKIQPGDQILLDDTLYVSEFDPSQMNLHQ